VRSMGERYRRPDWVRRVNAMADSVGGDPRRLVPIDGFGHDFPPQLFERLGDLIASHALRSPT